MAWGRLVLWNAANEKHIVTDHPERNLSKDEIEAMDDPAAISVWREEHDTMEALGQTRAGRWLIVAWAGYPDGRYPVHAVPAGDRTRRRWIRKWQTKEE